MRSLKINSDKRIYVGAQKEFGYFLPIELEGWIIIVYHLGLIRRLFLTFGIYTSLIIEFTFKVTGIYFATKTQRLYLLTAMEYHVLVL